MLLTWDSGLHSYQIAALTHSRQADFLGRVPTGPKFRPIKSLSDGSYLAYIQPDNHGRRSDKPGLLVRLIEYTLTDPNRTGCGQPHRLMTSLLDAESCPALDLVCAYHERWEIELTIDELDTHQRLPSHPLRSRKPAGVIQELFGLLIAHYAIRRVIFDSATRHHLDSDRISFTNALEHVCDAIPKFRQVAPEDHPRLYLRLLDDVARHRLPTRADRINPRVVKRRMSKFPLKRRHHRNWPQPTKPFRDTVALSIQTALGLGPSASTEEVQPAPLAAETCNGHATLGHEPPMVLA
jgi:hypothetical protein